MSFLKVILSFLDFLFPILPKLQTTKGSERGEYYLDVFFWLKWSDRDFTYHPAWNNQKNERNMWNKFSSTRHQAMRTVISERRKINMMSLTISQTYCLENFPGYNTGRGNPGKAWHSSRVKEPELRILGHQSS